MHRYNCSLGMCVRPFLYTGSATVQPTFDRALSVTVNQGCVCFERVCGFLCHLKVAPIL